MSILCLVCVWHAVVPLLYEEGHPDRAIIADKVALGLLSFTYVFFHIFFFGWIYVFVSILGSYTGTNCNDKKLEFGKLFSLSALHPTRLGDGTSAGAHGCVMSDRCTVHAPGKSGGMAWRGCTVWCIFWNHKLRMSAQNTVFPSGKCHIQVGGLLDTGQCSLSSQDFLVGTLSRKGTEKLLRCLILDQFFQVDLINKCEAKGSTEQNFMSWWFDFLVESWLKELCNLTTISFFNTSRHRMEHLNWNC